MCDRAQRAITDLNEARVAAESLVITTRVSKAVDEYTQRTASVAALTRAEELGFVRSPGQSVQYVIVDDETQGSERIRLASETPTTYDPAPYVELVIRATESVVSHFGWARSDIRRHLATTTDLSLSAF